MTGLEMPPPSGLTARRLEVVRLLAQGLTATQAGRRLGVRETTVRTQTRAALAATGSANAAQLVAKCMAWDLISAEDVLGGES